MPRPARNRRNFQEDRILTFINHSDRTMGLLDFLATEMPSARRSSLKTWLKYGHLMAGGTVTTQFDAEIAPGTEVCVNVTRPFVVFRHPRMQIVYEDADIIVVNKGAGLLSVGTGSMRAEETAYSILKDYVKAKRPDNKIFVVHRLDRGTSGLMMFAKNPEAQQAMQHNWANMVIDRRYVAVLEGILADDEGTVKSYLGETSQFEVYSSQNEQAGKPAVTRFKVLKRGGGHTLAEFSLDTGRKNQIRVHARELGHPIVGDRKYGAKSSPLKRIALHARSLRFAHPMTRRDMNFELPIPHKFMTLL